MGEIIWSVLMIGVGILIGLGSGKDSIRSDAVEAGAAYYACSPDTGKCTFTWKAPHP